jgi:hypothetical protein
VRRRVRGARYDAGGRGRGYDGGHDEGYDVGYDGGCRFKVMGYGFRVMGHGLIVYGEGVGPLTAGRGGALASPCCRWRC